MMSTATTGNPGVRSAERRRSGYGRDDVRPVHLDAATGDRPQPVPAHRGLRVPVRLRDQLPHRAQRRGGVDVPAPAGRAQRVQRPARPGRGCVPARPLRRDGAGGAAVPAGQPDAGDHLADPHRLAHRARRALHGAVAQRGRAVAYPPQVPHRLRRRALPAAHRQVRQRRGGRLDDLRAGVRLRPDRGRVALRRVGVRRGGGDRPGHRDHPAADHGHAAGHRGPRAECPDPDGRGRRPLRRAGVVAAAAAEDAARGG